MNDNVVLRERKWTVLITFNSTKFYKITPHKAQTAEYIDIYVKIMLRFAHNDSILFSDVLHNYYEKVHADTVFCGEGVGGDLKKNQWNQSSPPPVKSTGHPLPSTHAYTHTHTYTPLRFDLSCEWSQYIPYVLCWNIIHLFHVDLFTKCSGAYLLPINLHHAVTIVHICSLYLPILHEMQAFGTSIIGFVKAFVVSDAVQFAWYTVRRHLDLHKSPVHYRIVLLKVTRWHCWR